MTQEVLQGASDALKNVGTALTPGKLSAKIEEFDEIIASGDSVVFEGTVSWTVTLKETALRLKGQSESVNEAFEQMRAVMQQLLGTHGDEDEVFFTLKSDD